MNHVSPERRLATTWQVRVSQDELALLQRVRDRHGMSRSTFLRYAIQAAAEKLEQTESEQLAG